MLDPYENTGGITSEYAAQFTYYSLLIIWSYCFNQLILEKRTTKSLLCGYGFQFL